MADLTLSRAKALIDEAREMKPQEWSGPLSSLKKLSQEPRDAAAWKSKAQEAAHCVQEILVFFRKAGEAEKKVAALKVLVEAKVMLGQSFEALTAANDELAMIKRLGDKRGQAQVLQMISDAQILRGESGSALETINETIELQQELGDKLGEARALQLQASVKVTLGRGKEALTAAEQAVTVFRQCGDRKGEADAMRTINRAFVQIGQLDTAPGRPQALEALQVLETSIERKDKKAWEAALQQLEENGAYTPKDIERAVAQAVQKDRQVAASFLRDQGISTPGVVPQLVVREQNKKIAYIGHRMGGLQYGPSFQCAQNYCKQSPSSGIPDALSVLQVSHEADDWERDLAYHPGCLDGMLQSFAALA